MTSCNTKRSKPFSFANVLNHSRIMLPFPGLLGVMLIAAAHELAHILIHEPYLDLSTLSKDEEREMEQQANDFASAFLLPKEPFIRDVSMFPIDLDHYVFMKKKWHVSVGVMIRRAYNLGVITFNQYSYLQRQMSKNGWRKKNH